MRHPSGSSDPDQWAPPQRAAPYDLRVGAPTLLARDLLAAADEAGAAGDLPAARAAYVQAYDAALAADDSQALTRAALGLAAGRTFGFVPGRVPAFLHAAYTRAEGLDRARLAVALARAWVYGGNPSRAVEFATEAIAIAETSDDPALLAEALDAELLVHWGPDDLDARLAITTRLEDVVAHVADVEARMSAHLWRLTTAMECLDLHAVQRQLRSLDLLAAESNSPRVRFFADARRAMYALMTSRFAEAEAALTSSVAAGTEAGEADTFAIQHALGSALALMTGDLETLRAEAASYEDVGTAEGVTSIIAEGAVRWLAAGEPDRAARLLRQVAGPDFGGIARDVDWLLTMACLTRVAAGVGDTDLAGRAIELLEPYAGRGVPNAGAVTFEGVVDEYLCLACAATGSADAEKWRDRAVDAYERLGAAWWVERVSSVASTSSTASMPASSLSDVSAAPLVVRLCPGPADVWTVGREDAPTAVRGSKGLQYLRLLLARPSVEVRAVELSDAVRGHPGTGVADSAPDELVDRQALAAYRRRLTELDAELDEAEAWADPGRADRLRHERAALLDQVGQATGLGGRSRHAPDTSERARVAVRKAIASAVARVEHADPVLGRLLRDTVTTGALCRYEPDPGRPVRWILDDRP